MLNTEYTRNIVCPVCGYEDMDSWEKLQGLSEDEDRVECEKCGEEFYASRNMLITYSSRKIGDGEK